MNVITILCDTLRRDHCGPYHGNRPLAEVSGDEQPDWVVPTPNIDYLAKRGTVFDNCYSGSLPCMPARRDIYTGRFEFLTRGWGPLEDDDLDLPRQISGLPNNSLSRPGVRLSYLISDHYHLWEQGGENYHTGYSGFQFIRGMEGDGFYTDPIDLPLPAERYRLHQTELHYRNAELIRRGVDEELDESKWFAAQTFEVAADWLRRNHSRDGFYLHIDSFSPHEPWDPPERYVKMFDPRGYDVPSYLPSPPYARVDRSGLTKDQVRHTQALYAGTVVHVDDCLGRLLEALECYDLWADTLVIFTADHGTFNGARGRMGKNQTHLFDPIAHIPLIVCHPQYGHGERRAALAQLVDLYPTTLSALGLAVPPGRHGIDLLPIIEDPQKPTREYAIYGMFGHSVSVTDGRWVLHQQPVAGNSPLYWYSYRMPYARQNLEVSLVDGRGRRSARLQPYGGVTWLSDKLEDPNELVNVANERPAELAHMQGALRDILSQIDAPEEQLERLGLT